MKIFRSLIFILLIGMVPVFYLASEEINIEKRREILFETEEDEGSGVVNEILVSPTMDSYVKLLLLNNPELKKEFELFKATLNQAVQEKAYPDPMVSYSQFVEEIQTRTGPQTFRVGLSQKFPWFGKLKNKGEVAFQKAEIRWQTAVQRKLKLIEQFKTGYFEYSFFHESLEITQNNLELLKQLEPVIQSKVATGQSQEPLIKLQTEIAKLENEVKVILNRKRGLNALLVSLLNLKQSDTFLLARITEQLKPIKEVDFSRLSKLVNSENPLLSAGKNEIEMNRNQLKLSKLEYFPDASLGVSYINTDDAVNAGVTGSGDDPLSVDLSFNLPIRFKKIRAGIGQAESNLSASQKALENLRLQILSDLEVQVLNLEDSVRQVGLYQNDLIPLARQALKVTEADYQAGRATLLDFIDNQRSLLSFELALQKEIKNYYQTLSYIETLCGGSLS